ncbi:MAG TPA: peptide-methionine (S)-S-oxide reductase MsrA [Opitutaceae bacterium]|jgi:peptide-methionine (S)-S-oxide reductase|nr:peptide-methionine (S)-S-oxide reductase MsrA [Opitutaceae bacterium]
MRSLRFLSLLGVLAAFAGAAQAKTESIVLGGGCFWCMDASYKLLPGVVHITCGYAGGHVDHPSYEDVCTETTGHAEVVKVDYDPAKVSLERVLDYFWDAHNATQVGGQGPDMGSSYRSIILYANEAQRIAAERSKAAVQKTSPEPLTTEIVPLKVFWPAEDYHQDYFAKHPDQAYCTNEIKPKVDKLKRLLKATPPPPAG